MLGFRGDDGSGRGMAHFRFFAPLLLALGLACAAMGLTMPAAAGWTLPCLFGGCSITFVSAEYAALPVQKLDPEAALAEVNAFRTKNGRKPLVLDARLSRAAAMQSKNQATRSWIG